MHTDEPSRFSGNKVDYMTNNVPHQTMEISEGYSLTTQSDSCRGKCPAFSWRWVLCVAVVVVLMVLLGILVAMFGPGSTDLKYHDRKDCTGINSSVTQGNFVSFHALVSQFFLCNSDPTVVNMSRNVFVTAHARRLLHEINSRCTAAIFCRCFVLRFLYVFLSSFSVGCLATTLQTCETLNT